jgi:4-amino-4-deoxy-L-arabinose transferase-like glycosyltransferase
MRGTLHVRLWTAAVVIAAAIGALAWPWIAPHIVSRLFNARITLTGPGPAALRWANDRFDSGIWIDFDDPIVSAIANPDGSRTVHVRQWLPSYGADRFEAVAPEGSTVAVSDARIESWLVGVRLPTRHVNARTEGKVASLPSFPPVWRSAMLRGSAACAGVGAALALLAWGLWSLVQRLERVRSPRELDQSAGRGWTIAAVLAAVGLPGIMSMWAPMLILADSTAYIWFAHVLLQTGSIDHFDGWRMPGYGLLLAPFISWFRDYAVPVGWLHAAVGAATALLVLDMLRRRVPRPWAHVAAILVAADPILLGWQRVLMGETFSAFFITLGAWLFLRLIDQARSGLHAVLLGLALGAISGAACLVRGNNQVLPVVLIAGLLWCGVVWSRRGALLAAAPATLAAMLMLLPLCVLNHRHYDRFTPAVGRNFTRSLFSWENGTTDWNQTGTLSFTEFIEIRNRLRARSMTDWDVMEWLAASTTTVPVPERTPAWLAMEVRSGVLVDEAVARRGPSVTLCQLQSFAGLLGFPVSSPAYALDGTWAIFAQLRGEANPRTTTNFDFTLDKFPPDVQHTIARTVHDVSWTQGHPVARVYGAWFDAWRWLRAAMAVCYIAALLRLVCTGRWAYAFVGLVVLANCVGVPVLTYAAEYRYAAPFYPLAWTTMALGLFAPPARKTSETRRA